MIMSIDLRLIIAISACGIIILAGYKEYQWAIMWIACIMILISLWVGVKKDEDNKRE